MLHTSFVHNFAVLTWHPHLSAVVSGLLIAVLTGWGWWIHRQLRRRFTPQRALLLTAPKAGVALLLVVALLDPQWSRTLPVASANRVLAVVDVSSSMDVKDEGGKSRLERAALLVDELRKTLPADMPLQVLEFDTAVRQAGSGPLGGNRDAKDTRQTDLGGTLLALSKRTDLSSHAAVVLFTDGGDEPVENVALPAAPLVVVGVGNDLTAAGDLAIDDVQCPPAVEKNSAFELAVELSARKKGGLAGADLSKVPVLLEREQDGKWLRDGEQPANLEQGLARLTFKAVCPEPGLQRFRVSAAKLTGELSHTNNSRTVVVEVRKKTLHVLYFARDLGAELKMLRGELIRDPGVTFTALYRTMGERFTVQGSKFPGDDKLEAGFPTDAAVLKYFDCVIIGALPAGEWQEAQRQTVLRYVEAGGAVVFLGGEELASGAGAGAQTLAPLLPWEPAGTGQEMLRGDYAVSVPPATASHPVMAGLAPLLGQTTGAAVESVCPPGALKPGATALMTVVAGQHPVPLVAVQRYGKGNVLAIASNTLWKWARKPGDLEKAYGLFWRQAVRHLAAGVDGGQLLAVKWNSEAYKPGEKAVADIRCLVPEAERELQLDATLTGLGATKPLPVEPLQGQAGSYTLGCVFEARGNYHVTLVARQAGSVLERYDREFPVGALSGEGSHLELDDAALRRLAQRGGGMYLGEHDASRLGADLAARRQTHEVTSDAAVVSDTPWFAVLFLLLLAAEWTLRRKGNLI